MRSARKVCNNQPIKILTNGPAKLAQAFGIVRNGFDGADLCSEKSIISVHDIGICYELSEICVTTRIGIREDADKPWRFYVKENDYISKK
jgi:DNA-3-methyladenine glycosylase